MRTVNYFLHVFQYVRECAILHAHTASVFEGLLLAQEPVADQGAERDRLELGGDAVAVVGCLDPFGQRHGLVSGLAFVGIEERVEHWNE